MNTILACLYVLGLYAAYVAGRLQLRAGSLALHRVGAENGFDPGVQPRVTLGLVLITAIPTTLQFVFPAILDVFERDYSRIAAGDWWRLGTALLVQDGGVGGSSFNLISLVLLGRLAEQRWGGRRLLVVYLIGGFVGEAIACGWRPVGAGNSVANFSLAASIAVASVASRPSRLVLLASLSALGADLSLLLWRDIHGAASLAGAVVALVLIELERRGGSAAK